MICSVFLWKRHFKSPQDRIKTKVRSICVRKKFKSPETVEFQGFSFGGAGTLISEPRVDFSSSARVIVLEPSL